MSIFKSLTNTVFALAVMFSLAALNNSHAQVFDVNAIDGSFAQSSILEEGGISYGLQPFAVTTALASADGLIYHAAFSAAPVGFVNSNETGLDVRTWDTVLFFISTLADALNGTPTAIIVFNPLESQAANGQQLQEIITTQLGPNGETHHTFIPVTDLGLSSFNNPYHQLSETFSMDEVVSLNDGTETTLGQFLTGNIGQTFYVGSSLNNDATNGVFNIAATPNLGLDGVLFSITSGQEVEAGFAHQVAAIVAEVTPGDVNQDGDVTFADISPFVGLLATGDYQEEADLNNDSLVNFRDIAPFIDVLSMAGR